MKRLLYTTALLCLTSVCYIGNAQTSIGIGTNTPNTNAVLELSSTTQGLLVPRLTTVERGAMTIAVPEEAMLVYDTDIQQFYYWDGAAWNPITGTGGADTDWTISGNDMYANVTGNVGVGTSGPTDKFHIVESANISSVSALLVDETQSGAGVTINEAADGVGLSVVENGTGAGVTISSSAADGSFGFNGAALVISSAGRDDPLTVSHTNQGTLYYSRLTNTGVWTNSSDRNKKHNINDIEYGLKDVLKIKPASFNWIGNEIRDFGFIAQDLKEVVPELVFGEEGEYTVAYSQMTPIITKAIQEQQELIKALQEQIKELQQTVSGQSKTLDLLKAESQSELKP